MDQQILAMRVFVRIVEAGSFAKAGDSLQVPRATTSKLIQDLESHLSVKLLQRTTRRLTVTAEGVTYYERAVRILSELQDADASVGSSASQLSGRVRVDLGSSLANLFLIPALPRFHERYPKIQIDLGVSDRTVNLIEDGVDCVIRGGDLSDTTLIARRIAEMTYVTCASREYLESRGAPSHPRELEPERGHGIVHYFSALSGRPFPLRFDKSTESYEITGLSCFTVNESTAHLNALLAGLGVGQTLTFMAAPHIDRGALVPLLTEWTRPAQSLHALYPPNRHLNAKVRAFIEWAAEVFARLRN